MNQSDDKYRIGGGFAFVSAPFAVHPNDERRARATIRLMKAYGRSRSQIIEAFRDYVVKHSPLSEERQMERVYERLDDWLD
jgi:hypothetical protein